MKWNIKVRSTDDCWVKSVITIIDIESSDCDGLPFCFLGDISLLRNTRKSMMVNVTEWILPCHLSERDAMCASMQEIVGTCASCSIACAHPPIASFSLWLRKMTIYPQCFSPNKMEAGTHVRYLLLESLYVSVFYAVVNGHLGSMQHTHVW